LYHYFLGSHSIPSDILPICGNIPLTGVKSEIKKNTQFVLFGTIHPGAPFEDFISDLLTNADQFSNPIQFIFIGKNGSELSNYASVLDKHAISYEVLGIQSENVISQVLIDSDYGISTTPYFQTEKSGVYAAYREHQINTISVSREWTPTKGQYVIPNIIRYKKNNLNLIPMKLESVDLRHIAKQFINSIS
jgi:methylmalonyl-CoA mutase cobalamin-binding subunit